VPKCTGVFSVTHPPSEALKAVRLPKMTTLFRSNQARFIKTINNSNNNNNNNTNTIKALRTHSIQLSRKLVHHAFEACYESQARCEPGGRARCEIIW
jgi:hypothetical protein